MQVKESWIKRRSAEMVDDLNAVRAAILGKEKLSPVDHARLEPRLFESWVIEKLAQQEGMIFALTDQIRDLQEELAELDEEVKALRKAMPKGSKPKK